MLPPEAIQEFKQIYKDVFNEEISDADAIIKANRLLDLYSAIFESLAANTKEEVNKNESRSINKWNSNSSN